MNTNVIGKTQPKVYPAPVDPRDVVIAMNDHAGQNMVDYLLGQGITGTIVSFARREDVFRKVVYGVIPYYLAAIAQSVTIVEFGRENVYLADYAENPELMPARMITYQVKHLIIPPMGETAIVTRHRGTQEWLIRNGINGPIYDDRVNPADVAGKVVFGVLPYNLAAYTKCVATIEFPRNGNTRNELSADQLDMLGARVVVYQVNQIWP